MGWMVQQSRMVWTIFWLCGQTGVSDAVRDTCEVQWAARDWGLVHAVLAERVCDRRSRWPNTRNRPVLFTPSVVRVKGLGGSGQGCASIQLALAWKGGALLVPASCCLACSAQRHCVSVIRTKQIMGLIMFGAKAAFSGCNMGNAPAVASSRGALAVKQYRKNGPSLVKVDTLILPNQEQLSFLTYSSGRRSGEFSTLRPM